MFFVLYAKLNLYFLDFIKKEVRILYKYLFYPLPNYCLLDTNLLDTFSRLLTVKACFLLLQIQY